VRRASSIRRKARRVLVVDDEPLVARAIVRSLDAHETVTAHCGEAALAALRSGSYDAIVTDFMLPDMDGSELFETIAALRPDLARRTVFVTGGTTDVGAVAFLDGLPNPVVAKPFQPDELRDALASVLEPDSRATGT
jgi:CheY-like chemotaxis protein